MLFLLSFLSFPSSLLFALPLTVFSNVVNLNLEELQRLLVEAERELERAEFLNPDDKGLAVKRAKAVSYTHLDVYKRQM